MPGDIRLRSGRTSRLGIVAPHPPLRGTFSLWENDAPRRLRRILAVSRAALQENLFSAIRASDTGSPRWRQPVSDKTALLIVRPQIAPDRRATEGEANQLAERNGRKT